MRVDATFLRAELQKAVEFRTKHDVPLMLAMEEDVEPSVAIDQCQEAFKVVAAAEKPKYVAALRLLERVRSSTLELTADDGDVIENLGKKTDSMFDSNRANPSLSIDGRPH